VKQNIIFDFGAVLIDWNPDRVYLPYFKNPEKMNQFYNETGIHIVNKEMDRGMPFDEVLKSLSLKFPHHQEAILFWKTEWHKMIGGPITDTISILEMLHNENYPLYGLTNWSAETFPYVYYTYDFFKSFKDIVVSGREKCIKPEEKIYKICLGRNNLNPENCIFIDDNSANVESAEKLGMKGIVYTDSKQLAKSLMALDVNVQVK
jgi:2-haloacid dehalogenase